MPHLDDLFYSHSGPIDEEEGVTYLPKAIAN